jgi:hypothetical protein
LQRDETFLVTTVRGERRKGAKANPFLFSLPALAAILKHKPFFLLWFFAVVYH